MTGTDLIRLQRQPLAAGGYLAHLSLNSPKSLNSLNLEMVQALLAHLRELAADDQAAAVFLDGEGARAFCAGGDVRRMRESALAGNGGGRALEAERFFETEYRVDHLIHHYPKPVICWAHGIVMGGGLGLLAGASHRIVTGTSRLAMPEITIGLYPDVGASWFLRRMPGRSGLFCALTGAQLNAADALYAGLADYCLDEDSKQQVLHLLQRLDWQCDGEADRAMLTDALTEIEADQDQALPDSHLKARRGLIEDVCGGDLPAIAHALGDLHGDDAWLNAACEGFRRGAASTAKLVFRQLQEGAELSLTEAFQQEMVLSANRVRDPEFVEGVRAQIVDKDREPAWRYAAVEEVPDAVITALFDPPWPRNPLADLDPDCWRSVRARLT